MLLTPNMIVYAHFLLVYQIKPNLIDKYFINLTINQVTDWFCWKPRVSNTSMNSNFYSGKFEPINLTLNRHIITG